MANKQIEKAYVVVVIKPVKAGQPSEQPYIEICAHLEKAIRVVEQRLPLAGTGSLAVLSGGETSGEVKKKAHLEKGKVIWTDET